MPLYLNWTLSHPETLEHLLFECPKYDHVRKICGTIIKTRIINVTNKLIEILLKNGDNIYGDISISVFIQT